MKTQNSRSLFPIPRMRHLAVSCLLASGLIAGCSEETTSTESQLASSISVGTSISIKALNPLDALYQTFQFNAFDALIRILPGYEQPEARLATSWTQVDPVTWDFTLRQGVKFHSGEILTADDVVFSFNEIMDKKLILSSAIANIESVSKVDDNTVRIVSKQADPLLLNSISQIFIVPKAHYLAVGGDGFANQPIGSGPYKITTFDINSAVNFEAFPEFWGNAPKTPKVELRYFSDASSLATALESGQVDVAHDIPANSLKTLKGVPGIELISGFSGNQNMIQFNTQKAPFDDIRVRQAAIAAIDVPSLIQTINYGGGVAEEGQLPIQGVFGYTDTIKRPAYDLDKARALLKEAGAEGAQIRISGLAHHRTLLEAIGGELSKAGFKPVIEANEAAVWVRQFREGTDADLFYRGTSYVGVFDADRPFSLMASGKKPLLVDSTWDELYQATRTELDPQARKDKLIAASQYLLDQSYVLYTYSRPAVNATLTGVSGADFSTGLVVTFENLTKQL